MILPHLESSCLEFCLPIQLIYLGNTIFFLFHLGIQFYDSVLKTEMPQLMKRERQAFLPLSGVCRPGQPSPGLVLGVTMPREPQRPTYCLIASNPTWEVWIFFY